MNKYIAYIIVSMLGTIYNISVIIFKYNINVGTKKALSPCIDIIIIRTFAGLRYYARLMSFLVLQMQPFGGIRYILSSPSLSRFLRTTIHAMSDLVTRDTLQACPIVLETHVHGTNDSPY